MIQFDMKRFLSVGRWDVTVNRRFYTNQATALLVLAVAPVVVRFLSAWAAGDVALFGRDAAALYPAMDMGYWIWFIMGFYRFVFWALPVVSLSYMLHNMVRKQGRIQELTLPASNVERFLWHLAFCLLAPMVVFFGSMLLADGINMLFAAVFGCFSQVRSLICGFFFAPAPHCFKPFDICPEMVDHLLIHSFGVLSMLCFMSTFALGNAWKYRYNLIFTCLMHVVLWFVLGICLMFLAGAFLQFAGYDSMAAWNFNFTSNPTVTYCLLNLFMLSLLVGIWALTYKLYCDAQVTSRRNR